MAKILYFGRLGDVTGTSEEVLEIPADVATAGELRHWLDLRFDAQGALLEPTVRIAINNEISFDTSRLSDQDEIALMPPVGGAEMLTVSDAPIDAPALLQSFEQLVRGAGGIVTFSGQVRPEARAGTVQTLHLQAYPGMTETGIREAMNEAEQRWPLTGLHVAHRTGDMQPGDTIVFVAAASAHRRAAFEAADFLMDYLKTKAVFWKREDTETGSAWVEPRLEDYDDADRWTSASEHESK